MQLSEHHHPGAVLFAGEKPFPLMPAVDHYAGSEKLIKKALLIQQEMAVAGQALFDVTCDCEDGARAGAEAEHAFMAADEINGAGNAFGRVGARIHDVGHRHWRQDLDILVSRAGRRLAFLTLPKPQCLADVEEQVAALAAAEQKYRIERPIPVHVLIETHGALDDIRAIVQTDRVESVDFGLMDFVSGHHGAIPATAMRSPGQFEHRLIVRAKAEIVAAALAHGVVPAHNVTTEIHDTVAIGDDARRARLEFGFLRMWSIHPNQIAPILEAMRPDFSEVEQAGEILLAAKENDWGPIQYKGKLHDRASYRYYWELLGRARGTGVPLSDTLMTTFFATSGSGENP